MHIWCMDLYSVVTLRACEKINFLLIADIMLQKKKKKSIVKAVILRFHFMFKLPTTLALG
jgi:hypothetical protein